VVLAAVLMQVAVAGQVDLEQPQEYLLL